MEQLGRALIAGHVIPCRFLDALDNVAARGVVRVRSKFCAMQSVDIAAIAGHALPSESGPESTTTRSTVARPGPTTQPLFDATNTGRRPTKDAKPLCKTMSPTPTTHSSKGHSYHADNIDKVRVSIGPAVLAGIVLLPKKAIKPLWSSPLSGCTSKRSLAVLSSGCMTPRTRSSIKSLGPLPAPPSQQQQCVFSQLQLATFLRLARRSGDRHREGTKDVPDLRREVLKASVERLKIEEAERARKLRVKMEAQTAVAPAVSVAKDKKRRRRHWWKKGATAENVAP
ncbi:hypothetical protein EXIGLDRAFT_747049 [Exidia glandulosa HHB12029]|uniref:Uncharacterized protein n=1 Tax=Exidia glandulosa HHB12029 TaxID=1314781 RepID=A0A165L9F1_EXIGL|nr:hypothetical protein EXIGLDRAFT_747049 [Exidia glandulosa HHB12029]